MKNKKLMANLIVAISILISPSIAQNTTQKAGNENAGKLKPADATAPRMVVQQIPPTPSSAANINKDLTPLQPEAKAIQPVSRPAGIAIVFKPRPPEMNTVIPKEDVKPVLPSTIIRPVEGKPATAPIKENPGAGPKLAPAQ
jgi:hypothetical protein